MSYDILLDKDLLTSMLISVNTIIGRYLNTYATVNYVNKNEIHRFYTNMNLTFDMSCNENLFITKKQHLKSKHHS